METLTFNCARALEILTENFNSVEGNGDSLKAYIILNWESVPEHSDQFFSISNEDRTEAQEVEANGFIEELCSDLD